jgi:cytoskeleton protein RodZ
MPEIGATLRDARMRARIDISEIETETKIRAKYLRALENEEWDLLPGPTYVKSFLRTYAEALGLDAKLLIEEYKLRHERLSEVELQPITSPGARRRPQPRGVPRGWLIGFVVLLLLVALYFLGQSGGDDGSKQANRIATKTTATTKTGTDTAKKPGGSTAPATTRTPKFVRLEVIPTGQVYVCLEAAGGRRLIPGVILNAASPHKVYRSSEFRVTVGNGNVQLRINGRIRTVPAVRDGIGYRIVPRTGREVLQPHDRPDCK